VCAIRVPALTEGKPLEKSGGFSLLLDWIDRTIRVDNNCGRGLLTSIIDIRGCLSQLKPPADSKSAGGYDSTEIK